VRRRGLWVFGRARGGAGGPRGSGAPAPIEVVFRNGLGVGGIEVGGLIEAVREGFLGGLVVFRLPGAHGELGLGWPLWGMEERLRPRRGSKDRPYRRKLLKGQGSKPWQLVTDKLRSYGAAHRNIMPSVDHSTDRYTNNLAEVSHQPIRQRERQMRGFKSAGQAQRFLAVHGVIRNLFNLRRHQLSSANYPLLRERSFKEWSAATAAFEPSVPCFPSAAPVATS